MDVKWLKDFMVLARTRSFSAAARERHVTQPAFSRRIQALELWAGVALVDRTSQPVTLTSAGRKFRETAEETLRMLASARADLRTGLENGRPTIAVAALHSLATHFFPRWLRQMQIGLGSLNSRLTASDYQNCIAAISGGECDFMLGFWHPAVPTSLDPLQFPHLTIGSDSMIEVYAAGREPNAGLILRYCRTSFFGRLTLPLQPDESSAEPSHMSDNAMAEGLKGLVLAGLGTAWLPRSMVRAELAEGSMLATGRDVPLQVRLYRNLDRRREIVQSIWEHSRDVMQDAHTDGADGIGY